MPSYNGAGTMQTNHPRSQTILVAYGDNLALADGTQAAGAVTMILAASITDGQTLTLSDGINSPTVFEFRATGAVTAGNVLIDISGDTTAADVVASAVTAINGVGASLRLTATASSDDVVLTNDVAGVQGNVTTWASTNATINTGITQPINGAGLVPASGNTLGIAAGQLGVISLGKGGIVPHGEFIVAGQTKTEAPVIQIIQGTPNSANVANVGSGTYNHLPYVASAPINSAYAIGFAATVCSGGANSSWILGAADATTGAIPESDNSNYRINVTFDGVRQNRYFGTKGFDAVHASFDSLDYTTLSSVYSDPRDHIVQNLAYRINLNSKNVSVATNVYGVKPIIAFAINTSGGTGVTLTAAAAASVGTAINYLTYNGTTHSFIVDQAFKTTVATWIASSGQDVDGSSTIEVIDLSTAGTSSGKGSDVIVLMALDEDTPVVRNDLKPVKPRLRVGVEGAFLPTTFAKTEVSYATEEEGTGANWLIEYGMEAGHQVWSQQKWGTNFDLITPPNYIDTTKNYTAYVIDHFEQGSGFMNNFDQRPHRTIILAECSQSAGTADATTLSSLNSILAPWLNSCTIESSTANPIVFN